MAKNCEMGGASGGQIMKRGHKRGLGTKEDKMAEINVCPIFCLGIEGTYVYNILKLAFPSVAP